MDRAELYETIGDERFTRARRTLSDWLADAGDSAALIDLADSVLTEVDEIDLDEPYPEDRATEIADSAVPIYTAEIMEAIAGSHELMATEPELGPANGSNFDGTATPTNLAAANLYELASNIAHARLHERMKAHEAEPTEDEIDERAHDLALNEAQIWGNVPQSTRDAYIEQAREELRDENN